MGNSKGLASTEALDLRHRYGYNEVVSAETPEWKKVAWRYLDWVCIIIVSQRLLAQNFGF